MVSPVSPTRRRLPGEHRQSAVLLGDVVDELEHVDGLADPGAAEQAHLAALGERHQQIDDLDAGDQQVLPAGLLFERRRRPMDRQVFLGLHRPLIVLGMPQHVHDAPERAFTDRDRDRRTGGLHRQAALQAFRGAHGDGAHHPVAELLLHLERQIDFLELQRFVDSRDRLARELDVDDGADDLGNVSFGRAHTLCILRPQPHHPRSPKALS